MAVLREPGAYERLFATGRALMTGLSDLLQRHGFSAQVVGEPPMFDVVFADGPMRDYRDLQRGDKALAKRFNALLRERGILKGEFKHYVAVAHTEDGCEGDLRGLCVGAGSAARRRLTVPSGRTHHVGYRSCPDDCGEFCSAFMRAVR